MTQNNEQLVKVWLDEVWNRGLEASIHKYFHPQGVGHLEGADDVRGPGELVAQWKVLREAFPDFRIEAEDFLSQGDTVVFRWTATGTHRGNSLPVRATGLKVRFTGLTWARYRDGQMFEAWDRWNQGGVLADLMAGKGRHIVS